MSYDPPQLRVRMTIFGYENGKQYMNMKLLYIYIEQSKINYEIKQLISLHHEKQLKRMKIFNNENISVQNSPS